MGDRFQLTISCKEMEALTTIGNLAQYHMDSIFGSGKAGKRDFGPYNLPIALSDVLRDIASDTESASWWNHFCWEDNAEMAQTWEDIGRYCRQIACAVDMRLGKKSTGNH